MARAKKLHHQRSRALQQLPGDIEGEGLWLAEVGLLPWQRQRGLVALLCGVICAQRGWRKQFEAEHSDYWRKTGPRAWMWVTKSSLPLSVVSMEFIFVWLAQKVNILHASSREKHGRISGWASVPVLFLKCSCLLSFRCRISRHSYNRNHLNARIPSLLPCARIQQTTSFVIEDTCSSVLAHFWVEYRYCTLFWASLFCLCPTLIANSRETLWVNKSNLKMFQRSIRLWLDSIVCSHLYMWVVD